MKSIMTNIIWKILSLNRGEQEIAKLKKEMQSHATITTRRIMKMNIEIQDGVTLDIARSIGFASSGGRKVTSK